MKRVLSPNILPARVPRKANSAVDLLSRMQTDPILSLQTKLMDHVPRREIEKKTETKVVDVFWSNRGERTPFSEKVRAVVDEQFIVQLKAHGLFVNFFPKQPSNDPDFNITELFSLPSIPQVILMQTKSFRNKLNVLPKRTKPLNLLQEQKNDEVFS